MTIFSDALKDIYTIKNEASATVATYSGAAVKGSFSRDYESTLFAEGYGPTFECMAADVAGIAVGSSIVINGTTYKVLGLPQYGDEGEILLALSKD